MHEKKKQKRAFHTGRVLRRMEKENQGKKCGRNPLKRVLGAIATLVALLVLLGYATPRPTAWLLHMMFKTPRLVPPAGYAEISIVFSLVMINRDIQEIETFLLLVDYSLFLQ